MKVLCVLSFFCFCCLASLTEAGCIYKKQNYEHGETFPVQDGCNRCLCLANGTVSCSEFDCVPAFPDCVEGGKSHISGDEWIAEDGCNVCWCYEGLVSCTKIECQQDRYRFKTDVNTSVTCPDEGQTYKIGEHWNRTDGCNGCTCTRHGSLCSTRTC